MFERFLLLGALVAFGLTACGGGTDDPTGRTWTLTELDGTPAIEGTLVTLTFSDGKVFGSGGCNQYNGSATWGEGDLTIEPTIASTRMACQEPVMNQESAFLAILPQATAYRVGGDALDLLDEDGAVLARLSAS